MMRKFLPIVLALAAVASLTAQSPTIEERLKWWTDARFGMFIHWGIYSVPAGQRNGGPVNGLGEWIMFRAQIGRAHV